MTPKMIRASTIARDLGARGSRAAVAGPDPAADLPQPALAVLAAVPAWWAARAAAAKLSGSWLDISHALAAPLPVGLRDTEPDVSVSFAASAHDIGSAYVAALSSQVRRGSAQRLPGLIWDPACGAGALLLPPLREHVAAVRGIDPQVTIAGLPHVSGGVDTDPSAVWLANVLIAAEALSLLAAVPARRRRPFPALVRLGDGLQKNTLGVSAIVMNPPYGRIRLTSEDRARFAPTLYGHANLYGLFLTVRAVLAKAAPLTEAIFGRTAAFAPKSTSVRAA